MKTLALVLLLLATPKGLFPSVNIRLEYTFRVGDEYEINQSTTQTINQSIFGIDQEGLNTYSSEMTFKIVSLTKSGAKLEAKFLRIKNRSKTIMGDVTMDSEGTIDTMPNRAFKAITGKSFFIVMRRNGSIEEIQGYENVWSGINAIGLEPEEEKKLKESLSQMLSRNALKSNVELAMVHYDNATVSTGDSWVSKNQFPMDFPIQIDNTWNLVALKGTQAILSAEGVYTTTDKQKVINLLNGMKAKIDFTGKQHVDSNVDTKTGWPTTLRVISELDGTMIVLAGGMIFQDMEMPTGIHTETTYTFHKN